MSDECDWCEGAGCEECTGGGGDGGDGGSDWGDAGGDGACDWCEGAGCEECENKGAGGGGTCDWCDGAGCEACGGDGDAGDSGACDFCDGSGCDQCQDEGETMSVKLANTMYEADEMYKENPEQALELFTTVLQIATSSDEELNDEQLSIVFKSRKCCVLLLLKLRPNELEDTMDKYRTFLQSIPNVSRNEGSQAVDEILNAVASEHEASIQQRVYEITRTELAGQADSARLLYSVNMKLVRGYVDRAMWPKAMELLKEVHAQCKTADGQDNQQDKGSELLDVYAMYMLIAQQAPKGQGIGLTNEELFDRTKDLTERGVNNPKSISIIKEAWGKMYGDEGQWLKAKGEFYGAFINYQAAGLISQAKQCLKYVVVANMLSEGGGKQNIFDAPEAKAYSRDAEVGVVASLRSAFEASDVMGFNQALAEVNKGADPFILTHLQSLIRDFRCKAIMLLVTPYQRVRVDFLARVMKVSNEKVEQLLVQLILDGDLIAKLDQVRGFVDLKQNKAGGGPARKYGALQHWAQALSAMTANMPAPRNNKHTKLGGRDIMGRGGYGMGGMGGDGYGFDLDL